MRSSPLTDTSALFDSDDPALTTREAARMLGVSIGTVQKWVESGQLPGWKTPGGHRRVRRSAVLGMLAPRSAGAGVSPAGDAEEFRMPAVPDYPVGADEPSRLAAVRRSGLFASGPEPGLDRLAWLAAQLVGAPIALVSVLGSRRQWLKARHGLTVTDTPRSWAFCSHTVLAGDLFEVGDARADPRFRDNPLVTGPPRIRFYAGYPLRDPAGFALGALCIIDTRPRRLSPAEGQGLRELGRLAGDQLRLPR